ncbi:MAG: A24 family peptidase [Calditrichia bacterium]
MNIPILSFLILKGKCAYCQTKISPVYPFIEWFSALIAVWLFWKFQFTLEFIFALIMVYVLLVIAIIDLQTQLILNKVLFFWILIIFIFKLLGVHTIYWNWIIGLVGLLLGFGFYYFVLWLGEKMFKKESLGMGDVKFAAVAGFLLGADLIIPMTVVAALLALLVAVPMFWKKMGDRSIYIPFGPFLCAATLLFLLYGDYYRQWINHLMLN